MSLNKEIDAKVDKVYQVFGLAILQPIRESYIAWKNFYSKSSLLAVLILISVSLIFIFSCFLSFKLLVENNFKTESTSSTTFNYISPGHQGTNIGGLDVNSDNIEEGKKRAVDTYLTTYNGFFDYIGDFFNDYVALTVDPTGHSKTNNGSIEFSPSVTTGTKLSFSTDSFLFVTYRYSTILLAVVAPVLVLLVVITGLQILLNQSNHDLFEKLTKKISRLVMSGAMIFIITPFLLSAAVMTTNLLNKAILGTGAKACSFESSQTDLKCFFSQITDKIKTTQGGGQQVDIAGWDIVGWAKVQSNNVAGFVMIIPLVIITLIMVILLFVVLIQFVIRYLQLYFLFIIYPIVSVFWFNKETSKYYYEYWKQIITLLLQQPVFLICFVIFSDMSLALINDISKPANLLVFAIFLGFLATVPATLTARIFGDVWAMAENLQNASNQNFISRTIQNTPNFISSSISNRFKRQRNTKEGNLNSKSNDKNEVQSVSPIRNSNFSQSHVSFEEPKSQDTKNKESQWYQDRKSDRQKRYLS